MRIICEKVLKSLLAFVLAFSTLSMIKPSAVTNVEAANIEYEIYPTPHSMVYQEGEYVIRPEVNVVYEEGIDDVTKNRMAEVLAIKDKNVTVSNEIVKGKTNILVGTYQSNGYVDQYVQNHYDYNDDLFSHYGSYFLASNNDEIVILGLDTDAAFYGITSLKHIFNQMDGSTIRNFEMNDYADVNIRGFIEGYYGIPWSNEDRMALMEFGGDFKMTSYIFAPKDDPYHKGKWRELYPEDEINAIKEMVKVGNESKCRFVWTAHPFMGGFDASKADEEIQSLLRKFDQLYDAGVRQFGVLGDDVGSLDREIVIKMMNAVSEWAKEKGDVYDTVFCPAGYNHSWQGNYSELNDYDAGFPDDVQIFWTGEAVCQPVEQKTLDHFRDYNANNGERRAPLFWLNWPVNDINHGRLLMGKASLLHTDIHIEDIAGLVTNPMQESEASKVAIFAVADYSWNVKGFDVDKSWEDSFEYIEPDAAEELHTLAKHMSNPQPNGHGLVLEESKELQPLIDLFKQALQGNGSVEETGNQLILEMNIIIDACENFHIKSKNINLKEELLPFTQSLKDLCISIRSFVEAKIALDSNDLYTAFNCYTDGTAYLNQSKTYTKNKVDGSLQVVSPGSTHLIPLATTLQETLADPINDYVSGEDNNLVITAESSFNTFYSGAVENIIDGKDDTHAWHDGYEAAGQYYQVNFSVPATIYGVNILNGASQSGKEKDTFGYAKLKYKTSDSDEWKDLDGGKEYGEYAETVNVSGIEIEDVVAVRYECTRTGSGNKWPSMREFEVLLEPAGATFTKEVIRTQDRWTVHQGSDANLIDSIPSTGTWYAVRNDSGDNRDTAMPGDFIGVKLSQPIVLGKIDILQGMDDTTNDYFKNVTLQWSLTGNDNDWHDIQSYTNTRHIQIDLSDQNITAQYVRVVNNAIQKNWIGMREFDVQSKVYFNSKAYTNVEAYRNVGVNVLTDHAYLDPQSNITLNQDEYIGIKLDRVHEVTTIQKVLENADDIALETSLNGYEWTTYDENNGNVNARYIRLINHTNAPVTFNMNKLHVNTLEFYEKSLSLELTKNFTLDSTTPAGNLFDGDRTTQVNFMYNQTQGNQFVYDLGRTIHIDTLKVVCRDSEIDYPRHAKVSVSMDGKDWTDIMFIGNQEGPNEGEATNEDDINDVLPLHETSYNAKEVTDVNMDARYLKVEITRTKAGSNKWLRFQEIEINNGEYVPSVNDPTFSGCNDTKNGQFAYMTDNNLATSFIPDSKSGILNYTVSDNHDMNRIKIIQNANAISNATVYARVLTNESESKWLTLGTLAQTVNEFILPENLVLLDIKLEWENTDVSISEMILSKSEFMTVNKEELEKLLHTPADTTLWTKETADQYADVLNTAEEVYTSEYAAQESIDSVVLSIKNILNAPELKGDIAQLQNIADQALTDSENYTVRSWRLYANVLSTIQNALTDPENVSVSDVEKLIADYTSAKEALVFNPSALEEAILMSESEGEFIDSVEVPENTYTSESWNAYLTVKKAMDDLIKENDTSAIHPNEFKKVLEDVRTAKENLVNISELVEAIRVFEEVNKELYTEASYNAYKKVVDDARTLLVDGSKDSVAAALASIESARKQLVIKDEASLETLNALITQLESCAEKDYTSESYAQMKLTLNEMKSLDLNNLSSEQLKEAIAKLELAQRQLVSVKILNQWLERANSFDQMLYTTSSYKQLLDSVEKAKEVLVNGTSETVSQSISSLEEAIQNLAVKVKDEDAKTYIEQLILEDASNYTEESYQAYKDAYDALIALSKDLDDVSAEEFNQAKAAFENAYKGLVEKTTESDKPNPETPSTNDNSMMGVYLGLLGASAIALLVILRKKLKECF